MASTHPLIHVDTCLGIGRRQAFERAIPGLVARLHEGTDLVDELMVIGHRIGPFLQYDRAGRLPRRTRELTKPSNFQDCRLVDFKADDHAELGEGRRREKTLDLRVFLPSGSVLG
jgi:hypothetical protein